MTPQQDDRLYAANLVLTDALRSTDESLRASATDFVAQLLKHGAALQSGTGEDIREWARGEAIDRIAHQTVKERLQDPQTLKSISRMEEEYYPTSHGWEPDGHDVTQALLDPCEDTINHWTVETRQPCNDVRYLAAAFARGFAKETGQTPSVPPAPSLPDLPPLISDAGKTLVAAIDGDWEGFLGASDVLESLGHSVQKDHRIQDLQNRQAASWQADQWLDNAYRSIGPMRTLSAVETTARRILEKDPGTTPYKAALKAIDREIPFEAHDEESLCPFFAEQLHAVPQIVEEEDIESAFMDLVTEHVEQRLDNGELPPATRQQQTKPSHHHPSR